MTARQRNYLIAVGILGFAVSLALAWWTSAYYTPVQIALALAIIWIGALPSIIRPFDGKSGRYAVFPVSCLFYAICFGLPLFLAPLIWPADSDLFFYKARFSTYGSLAPPGVLAVIAAGLAIYIGAFYAIRPLFQKRRWHLRLPAEGDQTRLRLLLWGLLIVSIAYRYSALLQGIPSIGQFLGPAGYVALAGFFVVWQRGALPRWEVITILGVALPLWIAKIIAGTLITPVLMIALLLFLLLLEARPKAAVILVVMSATVLIGSSRLNYFFRDALPEVRKADQTAIVAEERMSVLKHAWKRTIETPVLAQDKYGRYGLLSSSLRRMSLLPLMTVVDRATPAVVPYWRGETYLPVFSSFVPRMVWPGKPEERLGRTFALRYELDSESGITSVNVPWIVELKANFGDTGVLIGMAIFGAFMAFIDRFFNRRDARPIEAAVGLGMVFPLVYQESNFSLMCGSLLPLAVCVYLYFRIGLRWRADRPPDM